MNETQRAIEHFLSAPAFAVVGASDNLRKFGARVFACYRRHGLIAYPVNPGREQVQGEPCYATLQELPERVRAVSVITPPAVTESVVEDAAAAGVETLWLQPGAESERAVQRAQELGIKVIHGGPCLLVELGC